MDKSALSRIFKVSAPMIAAFLSFHFLGITDILMVGALGKEALAGVGIAFTVLVFFLGPMEGILDSTTVLVSQALGKNDNQDAAQTLGQEVLLAIALGALGFLLLFPLKLALNFFSHDPLVIPLAEIYLLWSIASLIPYLITVVLTRLFLARQKNTVIAIISWITVGINFILNWILIFGLGPIPAMGVAGAGLATFIARVLQMATLIILTQKEAITLRAKIFTLKIHMTLQKRILKVGFPMGQSNFLEIAAWSSFVALIASLGTSAVAAHEIAMKIKDVGYLFGWALGTVGTTLVAQAFGSGAIQEARKLGHHTVLMAGVFMGFFSIFLFLIPEPLVRLFTKDPQVVTQAIPLLQIMALYQLADAAFIGYRGSLNGFSDTKFVRNVLLIGSWLIMVPIAFVLTKLAGFGLSGAWIGLTLYVAFASVVFFIRFQKKTSSPCTETLDPTLNLG